MQPWTAQCSPIALNPGDGTMMGVEFLNGSLMALALMW